MPGSQHTPPHPAQPPANSQTQPPVQPSVPSPSAPVPSTTATTPMLISFAGIDVNAVGSSLTAQVGFDAGLSSSPTANRGFHFTTLPSAVWRSLSQDSVDVHLQTSHGETFRVTTQKADGTPVSAPMRATKRPRTDGTPLPSALPTPPPLPKPHPHPSPTPYSLPPWPTVAPPSPMPTMPSGPMPLPSPWFSNPPGAFPHQPFGLPASLTPAWAPTQLLQAHPLQLSGQPSPLWAFPPSSTNATPNSMPLTVLQPPNAILAYAQASD